MKTLVICTAMSAMILCACGGKNTTRQADDGPQIALIGELALGFDEGTLVGAEQ